MYVIEFFDMSNKIRVKSGSRQPQAWLVNHGGAAKHSWVKFKIPAKNEIQKIRENDGSYLFLQRFDKFLI